MCVQGGQLIPLGTGQWELRSCRELLVLTQQVEQAVVYRLPAGVSLVRPASRCPFCLHPIRWYHNLPVLGWLILGGRCRDCRAAIPARYPLVELAAALMFVALAALHLQAGHASANVALARCGMDMMLACTLLCGALIEWDGARPPVRLFAPALAVGLIAPVAYPALADDIVRQVPQLVAWELPRTAALVAALAGLAAGIVMAQIARVLIGRAGSMVQTLPLACVGLYLGWLAAVGIATACTFATLTVHLAVRMRRTRRVGLWSAWLFAFTFAWIVAYLLVGRG